ncbi:MAG: Ig-like domain-containing protein [Terracidiphilus sp.]|jgi:hypothetical protein
MFDRISPRALLLIALVVPMAGCTKQLVDSIAVTPTSQGVTVNQSVQFQADGLVGHGNNHPPTTEDITNQVTWTSSVPSVATITSGGLATGVSPGSTTIAATIKGFTGQLTAYANLTVTGTGTGTASGVISISVIPGTQAVDAPGDTSQFIAIGTTAAGTTIDISSQVAWSSASTQIATIDGSGLATAVGQGSDNITALYTNPDGGSTVTGTATFSVTGGTTEQFTAITIIPNSQTLSASGQTGQFIALGTLGSSGQQEDVTNSPQITWLSSIPSIATVTDGGLATGVSAGSTTVTAELANGGGAIVSNTASLTITNTAAPEPLLSLTIIPSSITVGNLQDTGQFLAIGTFSTPPSVRDLTNSVTWLSSSPDVFPVLSNGTGNPNPGADAGVVTAYGTGSATIIAEELDQTLTDGSIQTATAQFNCPLILPTATTAGSCFPGSQADALLSTLTVYNEGLNTTDWLVTASSATGTADVLHCGPGSALEGFGGSVCVANYPSPTGTVGTVSVVLEAQATGSQFGGWSYNCLPSTSTGTILTAPPYYTAAGPNYCVVFLTDNETVGAIFN